MQCHDFAPKHIGGASTHGHAMLQAVEYQSQTRAKGEAAFYSRGLVDKTVVLSDAMCRGSHTLECNLYHRLCCSERVCTVRTRDRDKLALRCARQSSRERLAVVLLAKTRGATRQARTWMHVGMADP